MKETIFLFFRIFMIPAFGLCADFTNGLYLAGFSSVLFIVIFLCLIWSHHLFDLGFCSYLVLFSVLTCMNSATTPGLLMNYLRSVTRCTTVSFVLNCSLGIFGGTLPMVCFFLIEKIHDIYMPIYYMLTTAMITLISIFVYSKTSRERSIQ